MPTERDRYYSAPPSIHNVAPMYIWDEGAIITGSRPPTTGCFRPAIPTDFAASINVTGGLTVNTNPSIAVTGNPDVHISNPTYQVGITGDVVIRGATYTSNLTDITSGLFTIPTGTKSWCIAVESGNAYYNTIRISEGTSLNGGYDGRYTLSNPINIGCTGGRVLVSWEN